MKKTLRTTLYVFIGLVVLLLLGSLMIPRQMKVERSATIKAPKSLVFNQVNNLQNWDNWSPWRKQDPNMSITYSNPHTGKGAYYRWMSEDKRLGNGTLTLTQVVPTERIEATIDFEEWNTGQMEFVFEDASRDRSKVSWTLINDIGMNPIVKYMVVFSHRRSTRHMMDSGLDDLKAYCESLR